MDVIDVTRLLTPDILKISQDSLPKKRIISPPSLPGPLSQSMSVGRDTVTGATYIRSNHYYATQLPVLLAESIARGAWS